MAKKWFPGMPLPPWSGNDNAMRDWVFYQLDNFYRARGNELIKEAIEPEDPEAGDTTILELLDSGDARQRARGFQLISRILGPEIAERIQWKRKRGHPKAKAQYSSETPKGRIPDYPIEGQYDRRSRIRMARLAVPLIQNFWREHYDGKWYRGRGELSAHEIAAQYFAITEADVRRKPSGRRKKPRA